MTTIYFITHPEVVPDPSIPITMWDYADAGVARWQKILTKLWIKELQKIYTSPEPRAQKAAQMMADALGFHLHVRDDLGEINRPTKNILLPEEFAASLAQFYQFPDRSINGWEKAVDTQKRIVQAVNEILKESSDVGHIGIISHEDLGNLLLCHIKHVEIQSLDVMAVGISIRYENGNCLGWEKLEL